MGLSISSVMPTIAVDDLDRAIRFYSDTLGLSVRKLEGDMGDGALVEVGGSDRLLLYKSGYRRGETTYASFLVDDLEGAVREVRDKGVRFEEYDFPGLKTENGIADERRSEDRLVQGQRGQRPRDLQPAGGDHAQGRLRAVAPSGRRGGDGARRPRRLVLVFYSSTALA